MKTLKLKTIKKGSKLAIISPSAALPNLFPDIYELGLQNLINALEIEIVEMPSARLDRKTLYEHPELRAKDINDAFGDDQIDGIVCSIGGYESVRILKYLDLDQIMSKPKMIMGFSDATTFLSYLSVLGLPTIHGPSVMAGFAQLKSFEGAFIEHVKTFLMALECPYKYPEYKQLTHGYKDWTCMETLGECLPFSDNKGMHTLQGNQSIKGKLWGGNIEVLEFLKGTPYWPKSDFWADKILMFETSEDKPDPMTVGYMFRNYATQGILEQVKGVLFAKPKDYSDEEVDALNEIIKNILTVENDLGELLVMCGGDFGHTDPKWLLPLGCEVEINPFNKTITLLESPFEIRKKEVGE
ncbi:LD-carboxypeptidase [Fusibacter sp. Q10-2]|uniref:LD-carboxypeptidase n=2 Tax=Fusibacter ferrireducens TaxID=2785058 RepID=A0ABR9ZT44_9FIRM|nr:LD-carboxypeptidase [Fusibacter ferrireducens]